MTGPAMAADGASAQPVPAQLTDACAEVAPAAPADAAAGRPARYTAAPASTAEAAALLRAAAALGLTVVPRGSGSKLDWGAAPASCDLIIDTRRLDQVIEHAAGDLVVSLQAGVLLDDLAKVLSAADQRLALDPPGGGTIGGILATQAAGPLRFRYGSPRDLLIGITVVRADGTIARSGGKVVKNVAGYDLGKLFAGSYGTLGLITEATFRLHPQPQAALAVTLDCPDPQTAAATVQAMAGSPLAPSAVELCWPAMAAPITVGVLLEGDDDTAAGRVDRMVALLRDRATARQPPAPGKRAASRPGHPALAAVEGNHALASVERAVGAFTLHRRPVDDRERAPTLLQLAFWAGQLASVLEAVRAAATAAGLDPAVHGSAAAGVLQVELSAAEGAEGVARFVGTLRAALGSAGPGRVPPVAGSVIVLRAPSEVRELADMWGTVPSLGLMRAVKEQFDPERRMAPGRFAGGI
jgi:glycolate oxidase FAD binding subunit